MADKNFSQLLQATFDNGTIHFKHLEKFLNSLVTKLDLDNVKIDNSHSTKSDQIVKLMPSTATLKRELCSDRNPVGEMMNFVNLTKRVEALEISLQKISSLMQTIIEKNQSSDDNDDDDEEETTQIKNYFQHPDIKMEKEDQNELKEKESQVKGKKESELKEPKGFKKCCTENLNNQFKFEPNKFNELPLLQSAQICTFKRLEKACKKKMKDLSNEEKFANLCDLRELESHLKEQLDEINSIIHSNYLHLSNQICKLQEKASTSETNIEDIFFACEQNEGKIDETILSMNEFNEKIFCLKTDVKDLMKSSKTFKEQFVELNEKCEAINNVKTNKSYVDDQFKLFLDIMFDELQKCTKIEWFNEVRNSLKFKTIKVKSKL